MRTQRFMNYHQALILFWSCVVIFFSGIVLFVMHYFGYDDIFPELQIIWGSLVFLSMFPIIVLVPLIGSGWFYKKQKDGVVE